MGSAGLPGCYARPYVPAQQSAYRQSRSKRRPFLFPGGRRKVAKSTKKVAIPQRFLSHFHTAVHKADTAHALPYLVSNGQNPRPSGFGAGESGATCAMLLGSRTARSK